MGGGCRGKRSQDSTGAGLCWGSELGFGGTEARSRESGGMARLQHPLVGMWQRGTQGGGVEGTSKGGELFPQLPQPAAVREDAWYWLGSAGALLRGPHTE